MKHRVLSWSLSVLFALVMSVASIFTASAEEAPAAEEAPVEAPIVEEQDTEEPSTAGSTAEESASAEGAETETPGDETEVETTEAPAPEPTPEPVAEEPEPVAEEPEDEEPAEPAAEEEDEPASESLNCMGHPEARWVYHQMIVLKYNPLGAEHYGRVGVCAPFIRDRGMLFDYSNFEFGISHALNPAGLHLGGYFQWAPLSIRV